ncbi:hypothetical protein FKM82_028370 [Ascaphus truei]
MLRLRKSAVTFSSPGICMAVISDKWRSAQKRISAVRFISFLLLVPPCLAIYLTTDLLSDSIFILPPFIWSWKASKALCTAFSSSGFDGRCFSWFVQVPCTNVSPIWAPQPALLASVVILSHCTGCSV